MLKTMPFSEDECKMKLAYRLWGIKQYHKVLKNNLNELVNQLNANVQNILQASGVEFRDEYKKAKIQLTEVLGIILDLSICFHMKQTGNARFGLTLNASVPSVPEEGKKNVSFVNKELQEEDHVYPYLNIDSAELKENNADCKLQLKSLLQFRNSSTIMKEYSENAFLDTRPDVQFSTESKVEMSPRPPALCQSCQMNDNCAALNQSRNFQVTLKSCVCQSKQPLVVSTPDTETKDPAIVEPSVTYKKRLVPETQCVSDVKEPVVEKPFAGDIMEPMESGSYARVLNRPTEPFEIDNKDQAVLQPFANLKKTVPQEPSCIDEKSSVVLEPSTLDEKMPLIVETLAFTERRPVAEVIDYSKQAALPSYDTSFDSLSKAQVLMGHRGMSLLNSACPGKAVPLFNTRNTCPGSSTSVLCTVTSGAEVWDTYELCLEDVGSVSSNKKVAEMKPLLSNDTRLLSVLPDSHCQQPADQGFICKMQQKTGVLSQQNSVPAVFDPMNIAPGIQKSILCTETLQPSSLTASLDPTVRGKSDIQEPRRLIPEFNVHRWDELEVVISYVVDPHCFFIQRAGRALTDLMKRMNDKYSGSSPCKTDVKGSQVSVYTMVEGSQVNVCWQKKKLWYRGFVVRKRAAKNDVKMQGDSCPWFNLVCRGYKLVYESSDWKVLLCPSVLWSRL
ncbi:uncharacterized protein LOC122789915 isoform X2 [Protopterus annectens]|uniref:uncharacterized protein LOC122789915 isoform X2 n=1 Tax=Protopterus annectens TaxID=7888 RepID=UPI001CFBA6D7|nr:uncharacterized protein LOC122789915 isoform X2 [Protopterus annectens]